jgi:class 3 adenylate cyclase
MDPATTDPQPKEARILAAIVFTDVVGFSKLAKQNEARVYVALQRDMGVMTSLCRAHGGQVLNTMGDGMLLCFTSAVDAMSCAVEIQRTLHNQSLSLPQVEVLHHRIGVHLGDVIMNGDNIFGDGVNVAARLQALAKPDAVCFSSTVHEVVKNKLKLDALYLGPQQLKNLGEPVKVWQVPPISTATSTWGVDEPASGRAVEETVSGASGFKGLILVLASLVLLGGLGYGISKLKPASALEKQNRPSRPKKEPTAPPSVATTGTTGTEETTGAAPASTMTKQDAQALFDAHRTNYEFSDIVDLLKKEPTLLPDEAAKIDSWKSLADLSGFMGAAMGQANNLSSAIDVPTLTLPNGPTPAKVYLENGALVAQSARDGVVSLGSPVTPQNYLEIAQALGSRSTAPSEMAGWLELFSKEYGVSVQ